MKRVFPVLLLASLLLLALVPATSLAVPRPWISGTVGGSTYTMGDLNDEIDGINSGLAGSGLEMKNVTNGLGFGAAVGVDVIPRLAVGVGYDRLTGKSKISDPTGSIEYDVPANLFRVFGRYTLASMPRANGFLEASLGRITSAAQVKLSIAGGGAVSGDMEGSGVAFETGVGAELRPVPQFGFVASAGYRHATAGDIEIQGQPLTAVNGGAYSLDYSGMFLRAGVTVSLIP